MLARVCDWLSRTIGAWTCRRYGHDPVIVENEEGKPIYLCGRCYHEWLVNEEP